jgi:hypothetical protein
MRAAVTALAALAIAAPAFAVGLAPLSKEGVTAGPDKAFYLTVINPYSEVRAFRTYIDIPKLDGATSEAAVLPPEPKVTILPEVVSIKPGGQRRIMVILRDLAPGETREARVCAELAQQEGMIHARVCSKLSARRLAPRNS